MSGEGPFSSQWFPLVYNPVPPNPDGSPPTENQMKAAFSFGKWNMFDVRNAPDMAMFWVLLLYLAKQGKTEAVESIIKTIYGGVFKSVDSYSRTAGANRVSAWGAGRLNSLLLERLGLLSAEQASDYASGISLVAGFTIATEIGEVITKLFKPFDLGGRDDGFPDSYSVATP